MKLARVYFVSYALSVGLILAFLLFSKVKGASSPIFTISNPPSNGMGTYPYMVEVTDFGERGLLQRNSKTLLPAVAKTFKPGSSPAPVLSEAAAGTKLTLTN